MFRQFSARNLWRCEIRLVHVAEFPIRSDSRPPLLSMPIICRVPVHSAVGRNFPPPAERLA